MSPAMAAGVSAKLWEIGDIVALVEDEESKKDRKRGPYKKKVVALYKNNPIKKLTPGAYFSAEADPGCTNGI